MTFEDCLALSDRVAHAMAKDHAFLMNGINALPSVRILTAEQRDAVVDVAKYVARYTVLAFLEEMQAAQTSDRP